MSLMGKGIQFQKKIKFDINRKVIAHATTKAWSEVPHVSYVYEANVSKFVKFYQTHKAQLNEKQRITLNTILLKIISEALKAAPELNAHLYYHKIKKIGCHMITPNINIAIPWLLKDGRMITPVVKHLESKNLPQISESIQDLKRRIENTDIDALQYEVSFKETLSDISGGQWKVVRQIIAAKIGSLRLRRPTLKQKKAYRAMPNSEKLLCDDIFGGTVLVSNIGSIFKNQRGAISLLEIIAPQILVIGLNNIQDRPVVIENESGEKEIAIQQIMPITITWDHRAADTANIVPFQKAIDRYLQQPELILNWL